MSQQVVPAIERVVSTLSPGQYKKYQLKLTTRECNTIAITVMSVEGGLMTGNGPLKLSL